MDRQWTERTPWKCFSCGSVDNLIAKCQQPPKYNEEQQKQVRFSEKGSCVLQKESENGDNDNDQEIYEFMARISGNDKSHSRYFCDNSQLTNFILDSGATFHMTSQVSDFIPGSL